MSKTFVEIFDTVDVFTGYIGSTDFPGTCPVTPVLTQSELTNLYYLLLAKYQNSQIFSNSEDQFKLQVASIIFVNGKTWAKKLAIQNELAGLGLDSDDIIVGATSIYNHAYHDGSTPSTQSLNELTYIDDQNVTKNKRSKLDALGYLYSLLNNDVSTWFIKKFEKLFRPFFYESGCDCDDAED